VKKNFALAVALSIALSATAPVFASNRDGGFGRDRELNPIERVIKLIKKILHPAPQDVWGTPHP